MQGLSTGTSWAGLLAGPLAWGISTQLNYALADWQCRYQWSVVPLAAALLVLIAVAGAMLSWRAWRHGGASFKPLRRDTERFVAMLGVLTAALFALVVAVQGAASLILDTCTR